MKKGFITIIISILLAAPLLAACQSGASGSETGGLKVLAVETFLADIAQNVAGDRLAVDTLMPLGLDPHGFEATPQDVARIAESDVLIVNGAGFEEWLQPVLENAGGERLVIEAAQGLTSRTAREGEEAMMSDAERADEMCAEASSTEAQAAQTGADAAGAVDLPAESGLFTLALNEQGDGTYAGVIRYTTDEAGDFQIAVPAGTVRVQNAADGAEMAQEKSVSLGCDPLAQGIILKLEKDGQYLISLSGFTSAEISLLIGPAGGAHHHEGDPHFWLDPISVTRYVENIRDGLIAADPEGRDVYTANAAAYIEKLNELDAWIRGQVDTIPAERRLIVTNHESFGYYADRYGFQIIGTIIPSVTTGSTPSAQQMARLVDRIKASSAIAIFLETGSNPQLAEQISAETDIPVVSDLYTHSITAADGDAPTYIDMMKHNTLAIVKALAGE